MVVNFAMGITTPAALTVSRERWPPNISPLIFPDGHSIRVECPAPEANPPPAGTINVVLRDPDGREFVVWSPPVWAWDMQTPGEKKLKRINISQPHTAAIDGEQIGVILYTGPLPDSAMFTTWWIRWNLSTQSLLPVVMTNGISENNIVTLLEPAVLHIKGANGNVRLIPGLNGQLREFKGRSGEEANMWTKNHKSYFDHTVMEFGGEYNDWKVWQWKNSQEWPLPRISGPDAPALERILISPGLPPVESFPSGITSKKSIRQVFTTLWPWLAGAVVIVLALVGRFVTKHRS